MLVFDGTYQLQRKGDPGPGQKEHPACTWRVRIVDFTMSFPDVAHIKPKSVFVNRVGSGLFKASCAESLGKRVCRDFDLDVKDLLWIEEFKDAPGRYYAAVFKPKVYDGPDIMYTITWRSVMKNEMEALMRFIQLAVVT